METMDATISARTSYSLHPSSYCLEDILFCIDIDKESLVDMKSTGPSGRPFTRLDSIKQAIILFINAKLTINPDHRFAFSVLGKSASWLKKEFSNDVHSAMCALASISIDPSGAQADLSYLLRMATHEAKKSSAQNRHLRVILIYCRSSSPPVFDWPMPKKTFTFDVVYLHNKPSPENCPQKVYDALVEVLERVTDYEGYIFETGQSIQRTLFKYMCMLLSHPQQRCNEDEIDFPKALVKKTPPTSQELVPRSEELPM